MGVGELIWNRVGGQGQARGSPRTGVGGQKEQLEEKCGRRWESAPQGPARPLRGPGPALEAGVTVQEAAVGWGEWGKGRPLPPWSPMTPCCRHPGFPHSASEAEWNSGVLSVPFPRSQRRLVFFKTF